MIGQALRGPALIVISSCAMMAASASVWAQGSDARPELSLGCLKVPERSEAALLAEDFKGRMVAYTKTRADIRWSDTARMTCQDRHEGLAETAVVIGGWIDDRPQDHITIRPVLWRRQFPGALPLVTSSTSFDSYLAKRQEYIRLLVDNIGSILRESDMDKISLAIVAGQQGDAVAAKTGQRLLRDGKAHLALPLLQRGAASGNPDILFDLGIAYRRVAANRLAEVAFGQVLKTNPKHGQARMELGTLLLETGRYKEAAEEFQRAENVKGARSKYAVALFAMDEKARARVEAYKALEMGERSAQLTLLLVELDVGARRFGDALGRLKAGLFDRELESSFVPLLATIIVAVEREALERDAAEREDKFDVADDAYNVLIAHRPTPVSFMLYGRGLILRAENQGFDKYAPKAAEMFKRAATATEAQRGADPQLKVIELELAEALFMAGDNRNARLVAQGFRPDSDPSAATESYRPVAELIAMASDYLGRPEAARSSPNVSLTDEKLPYPELVLQTVLPSGNSARYVLARWDFSSFDRYACTLTEQDRDVVLSLSKQLQRRFAERGEKVSDGCPKPN